MTWLQALGWWVLCLVVLVAVGIVVLAPWWFWGSAAEGGVLIAWLLWRGCRGWLDQLVAKSDPLDD